MFREIFYDENENVMNGDFNAFTINACEYGNDVCV